MKSTVPPPAQPDAGESLFPGFPALDLEKLFRALCSRLWIAIAISVGIAGLATIHVLTAEKLYESWALINIEAASADSGVFQGIKGAKKTSFESLDALKSIAAGLTSGSVILRVADKLDLRNDPTFMEPSGKGPPSDIEVVRFLGERLTSELIRGERNIFLRVLDTDPERAQLIASELIIEFRQMLREQNAEVAVNTRRLLIEESEAQAKRVDEAEENLQEFREKHPDVPLDEDADVLREKYLAMQQLASEAAAEERRLRSEFDQLLAVREEPKRILEIGSYSSLESIQKLLLLRDQKMAEFSRVREQFTPKHPTYRAYDAEIAGLDRQVEDAAVALGESIENRYRSAVEQARTARLALDEQAALNLQAQEIRREFRSLTRARNAALATYDRLLERINDSSVTDQVDETVIHTFSPPLVNDDPVSPKKALTVAIAGIFGGCLGMGVILLLTLLDRTLSTKRQVESTLGLCVLSEIPLNFGEQQWDLPESILLSKSPHSLVSEGFRALRTSLSTLAPRSVLFTSPMSGEGKSFCAANLAILQAQMGYRTLLVDADFRNPAMARLFSSPKLGADGEEGLTVQNTCRETTVPNLFLISLGQVTDGGDPLSGDYFSAMLWEAYANFDCVIIDTSPLGMVSDGLNFSRYADAVVLVVQADRTEAGPAQEAVRQLRRMRASLAGCVLNGLPRVDRRRAEYVKRAETTEIALAFPDRARARA